MKTLILSAMFLFSIATYGATVPEIIKNLGGCFVVHYQFFEDGTHDYDLANVFERIDITEAGGVIKVQHYGIVNDKAVKHFRDEWSSKDGLHWTQRVIGPMEDFRYECTAPFKFNQWKCLVPNAPKPRRDHARSDYDMLDRANTVQITPTGWIQSEVNLKKTRDGKEVASELGWVIYKRAPASACPAM